MTQTRPGLEHVEGQRFRDCRGLSFEDFEVGDIYEHWPGRTVTETDNVWFTNLTMNTHPLHFDSNFAAQTEFGRPLVNSTLTLALVAGMCVKSSSQNAVANLGFDKIEIPAPVHIGDTLYSQTEVLAKRASRSRPTAGIVTVRHSGRNQHGTVIMIINRSFLVARRGHSAADGFKLARQ